jgi:hypothetical protein
MIIPTTDEMIYNRIIQETNNYNGLTIEQLAEKLEPLRKEEYKCLNEGEFNVILEEVVFKLLKYEVLYMIHGRLFLHDNILFVGDSIPDVLRNHHRYMDGRNFFYR